jgi:Protein of unknown function (DUF1552)
MNRRQLDRRNFLRAIGATALTYPFLRGVPSYAGDAGVGGGGSSGGGDPVYLVLLFSGCGVVRYKWGAQGAAPTGATAAVTSPLAFRDTLSAFTQAGPMKVDLTDKVTVLDGLNVEAANDGSHEAGMAALWTGTTIQNNGSNATGPSIDQAIAPLLTSQLGISRPFSTLPLMVQSSADYQERSVDTRMLYDATGNWVDPYSNPATTLDTLFPSATGGPSNAAQKTAFIRKQVFQQLNTELTTLQSRLCTEDRQQLQALQAVWNQAQAQIQAAASAAASCSAPTLASGSGAAGSDPFPANAQAMASILAMSLACDLTRVASLQFSHALSPVTHTWLGSSQQQTHHVYSHQGPTSLYSLGADLYAEPSSITSQYPQQLVDIDAWYASQVASLAYTLSQLTTASGKSLLDQTVICWGSELDMGAAHNHDDTPFVLVGGGGGRLATNRVVRFPLNLPGNNPATGNRCHNDLLTTLASVMGVTLPGGTFGDPQYCTQPIQEILT